MPTLTWIGKDAVVNHHKEVPFHLLRDDPTYSVGEDSGNLLVQGDNLLALKALLPHYAGQVKCIYIDPPYNTGNENWVYNDAVNSPEMRAWLGKVVGGDSEDLSRHDKWLCMMYPRLALLREMLREDGILWMSIDDNEVQNARAILDEILGAQNFIASFIWQKRVSADNDEKFATNVHDYILCYAKNKSICAFNRLIRTDEANARYDNPDNDIRGPWTSSDLTRREYRERDYYPIALPSGRQVTPAAGRSWSIPKENFDALVADNRIWFGPNGDAMPRRKRFLTEVSEGMVPTTWWAKEFAGDNQAAKREQRLLFSDLQDIFSTPKPVSLIERILEISTIDNDLVLDSFSGSGTTGHAVFKQNSEDGGNRHFILVEMDETICQNITAERLKRVALGYNYKDQKGNEKQEAGLGGGFRYCELGETLFDAQGQIRKEVTFEDLARHVYFIETGQPLPQTSEVSETSEVSSALLGLHNGLAVYLLYNGILKDKSAGGGNVLTRAVLASLPAHDGPKVIYGNGSLFSESKLRELNITFRQVPYEIKVN